MDNIKAKYISLGEKKDAYKKSQEEISQDLKVASDYLNAIKQVFAKGGIHPEQDIKILPTNVEPKAMSAQAETHIDFNIDEKLELSEYYLASAKTALNRFKAHSLIEQSGAALMDRVDRKFLVPVSLLPDLFSALAPFYTVLSENNTKAFKYNTEYFDSKNDLLYLQHQNGLLNRHKIRIREYVSSKQSFLEVKQKTNHFRTQKKRYLLADKYKHVNINDLLVPLTDQEFPPLYKKLLVQYERFTLKHKQQAERITIDVNLTFSPINHIDSERRNHSKTQQLPEIAIIELKQEKQHKKTEFENLIKQYKLRDMDFSKYCMGRILTLIDENLEQLPDQLKYNRFKSSLLMLKKIKQAFYSQHQNEITRDSYNEYING